MRNIDEHTITDAVIRSLEACDNPRLKQILQNAHDRLQALGDSESRRLNDEVIAVSIDDEPADTVGFAEDEAGCGFVGTATAAVLLLCSSRSARGAVCIRDQSLFGRCRATSRWRVRSNPGRGSAACRGGHHAWDGTIQSRSRHRWQCGRHRRCVEHHARRLCDGSFRQQRRLLQPCIYWRLRSGFGWTAAAGDASGSEAT